MAEVKTEERHWFNVSGEVALWVAIVSWIVSAGLSGFQTIARLNGGDPGSLEVWGTSLSYVGVVFALYGAVAFKFNVKAKKQ